MKKMISIIAIGTLLVTGFLFVQNEGDIAINSDRHPGILSVQQPTHFF